MSRKLDPEMRTILLIEDEPAFLEAMTRGLEREGYSVTTAINGAAALEAFRSSQPDLILLDLMLPGRMSGIDVCREIRRESEVPIIVVTAKDDEMESVVLLEVGADDYVRKPFGMRELIARIRAILRRVSVPNNLTESDSDVIIDGSLVVDRAAHTVTVDGKEIQLPRKEFELLCVLVENSGRVLTRQRLIDKVWGYDYVGDTKTLDVHIKRLRAKIETDPATPTKIVTLRGVGYKYVVDQS